MSIQKIMNWLSIQNQTSGKVSFLDYPIGLALGTATGLVRNNNEDRIACFKISNKSNFIFGMLVCDGMGGMDKGELCAEIAIATFIESTAKYRYEDIAQIIEKSIKDANQAVLSFAKGKGGTTIAGILIIDNLISAFNVGDSRVYYQNDKSLMQVTFDDTVEGQLIKLRQKVGGNFVASNELLQFIGTDGELSPHIKVSKYSNDLKKIIITSDGAHTVGNSIFAQICRHSTTSIDLIRKVLSVSDWIGGKDNSSVVTLDLAQFFSTSSSNISHELLLELWGNKSKLDFYDEKFFEMKNIQSFAEVKFQKNVKKVKKASKAKTKRKVQQQALLEIIDESENIK